MTNTEKSSHSGTLGRLSVAFLSWRRHLQRNLLPFNITLKQQFVLHQLEKKEYLYPSDIAEMLFCDRPTVTVILDNMAKQGWIRKDRDEENRKYVRISLTPAGRQKIAELASHPWQDFDPLEGFSDEEVRQLDTLIKKLQKRIDERER